MLDRADNGWPMCLAGRLPMESNVLSSRVPRQPPRTVRGLRRVLFLAAGGVFFALGVLGVVLPGLPATPFLLLTSYFLVRSSPRLDAALLRSRLFGPVLRDWREHHGVRRGVKVKAVVLVALAVTASVSFGGLPPVAALAVVAVALVGVCVVLRLPNVAE
jgi:uncharacterized membrane protein YbaN (DUF454 family)